MNLQVNDIVILDYEDKKDIQCKITKLEPNSIAFKFLNPQINPNGYSGGFGLINYTMDKIIKDLNIRKI